MNVDLSSLLHDSFIERIDIGPRREVRLRVVKPSTSPGNSKNHEIFLVRFGAIENFLKVKTFFESLPKFGTSEAYRDEILDLRQTENGWILELDHGGSVEIKSVKPPAIKRPEN